MSSQREPDTIQGAGLQRCPGLASRSVGENTEQHGQPQGDRARLEGTVLRVGGHGSSELWSKGPVFSEEVWKLC